MSKVDQQCKYNIKNTKNDLCIFFFGLNKKYV